MNYSSDKHNILQRIITHKRRIILFCFVLSGLHLFAQDDFNGLNKQFDNYKLTLGSRYACLIQKNGKAIYKKEAPDFQLTDPGELGSASQWLTAALVMWCVDQGKLSLDDNVTQYLPIFEQYSKRYITVRHCITHQTGLESQKGVLKLFEKNKFETLEDEANAYASKRDIIYNPGTAFTYNNVGINLAARIVELACKRGFEQLMMEKIIRPLGMKATSFSSGSTVSPASSAVSSAADMTNFLTMIANKGVYNGRRILSEKAVADMETLQMNSSYFKNLPPVLDGSSYGIGVWILERGADGTPTVIGFPNMFGSWFFLDKCRGYSCVFLTKGLRAEDINKAFYTNIKKIIDGVLAINGCDNR